ncbi:hypothetical protein SVAN01_10304 [Stagonosporopsis vannaccii]|nr:hypothetical protein SVAN01_10304 [Stagonosporopsis vannaccii]
MSRSSNSSETLANHSWQRTAESFQTPHPSVPIVYPNSGALQHLPIRRTINGNPARSHPSASKIFLRDLPGHCYSLPSVPINFTIVEILVLLPNWFKNKDLCERFMNNSLTAKVHFIILDEHRELHFEDEFQRDRARTTLTDEYRKTMRSIFQGWTKIKHIAPIDWDPMMMDLGGFVPDDMRFDGYRRVLP